MPQSSRSTPLAAVAGLSLAVAGGVFLPLQGRINGALGARLGDGIAAAVVSFSTGLIVIAAVGLVLPKGRTALRQVIPALRERRFPRPYALAGVIGALFVIAQVFTVGVLGVALFTVAVVTGQTVSGLLVDRMGIAPGGKRSVTAMRILGSLLTVAAVAWAVSPRFSASNEPAALLLPVLLPVLAGFLMSFQQAMNGTATVHYGSPVAATFVNFAAGAAVLWVLLLLKLAVAGPGHALPGEWWYYLGGPMGCVFIGLAALLVRSLGVLMTGLGMIAGQLLGSLALDVVLPAPGAVVALPTVLGTLLTLGAIILATLPWPRGGLAAGWGGRAGKPAVEAGREAGVEAGRGPGPVG